MKPSALSCFALCIGAAAALLAGCTGSQPAIGAPGSLSQNSEITARATHGSSWIAPSASSQDLLYAVGGGGAYIVSYPGGKLAGTTAPIYSAEQPCSDTQGNVYITSGLQSPGEIFEFAHGGTQPIRTLNDAYGVPYGCAVDPMTGDLAVANEGGVHGSPTGNLLVYKEATGTPAVYNAPPYSGYYFCAYDNKGNLFANNASVRIDKLVHGKMQMVTIVKNSLKDIGALQWDGQFMAITDAVRRAVYRFKITGLTARLANKTPLRNWSHVYGRQSSIYQGAFITPAAHAADKIGIWNYPAGGKRIATWVLFNSGTLRGVTISVATK